MAHFEVLLEQIQPFRGVNCPVDVRVTGTYRTADEWEIDYVEVPGVEREWESINRLHPLWQGWGLTGGIGGAVQSQETADLIEARIREDIAENEPQRPSYVIYRHQQAAE